MATIYRIAIEQTTKSQSDGRKGGNRLGTGKKSAKSTDISGGYRGGVEHNRKLRAINPVLNKATHGYWEKGLRLGRAGVGLANSFNENGFKALFGTASTIIIALILTTLIKWQNAERKKAQQVNAQNYKALENGVGAIHSAYSVSVNTLTGRQTYNQNK